MDLYALHSKPQNLHRHSDPTAQAISKAHNALQQIAKAEDDNTRDMKLIKVNDDIVKKSLRYFDDNAHNKKQWMY